MRGKAMAAPRRRRGWLRCPGILLLACWASHAGRCSAQTRGPAAAGWAPGPAPAPTAAAEPVFPLPAYLSSALVRNPLVDWNQAVQWMVSDANASDLAPRLFAFVHLAAWQALVANNASSAPADSGAVASSAAMLVLKDCLPLYVDKLDALHRQHISGLAAVEVAKAGAVAAAVVEKLLMSRLDDGFQEPAPLPPQSGPPGQFRDTGTAGDPPVMQYAATRPLLLPDDLQQLDFVANCTPPPAVPSAEYDIQYTSAELYGANDSSLRSPDQTQTALFWWEGGAGSSSIVSQWNRMALSTMPRRFTLTDTAELLAKLNVGLYDCTVAVYYLKAAFQQWRPITGIRVGDEGHAPQPEWTPLLRTPNSPTYPSTGAAYAGLTEQLLNAFYGRDAVIFSVATQNTGPSGLTLPTRVYQSFTQVGSEVAQSGYFGGVEFPVDSTTGRTVGGKVADFVGASFKRLA